MSAHHRVLVAVRPLAIVAALTLFAAACGSDSDGDGVDLEDLAEGAGDAAEDLVDEIDERTAPEGSGDQADDPNEPGEPGDSPDGGDRTDAGSGDDAAARAVDVPDDAGPLGSACRAYLRDDIPGMTIEVAYQSGAQPASGAVDHLVSTLREVVDKPDGVELSGPTQVPGGARTWTTSELRAFAAEHRTRSSSADDAAMYVLAVRGEFEQDGVLGVAVSATQLVVFPDNIGELGTDLLGGREAIERAVLVHEAGHLLCLLNITYQSDLGHEDPEHPRHSVHEDSVMHWAIETDAISQFFSGAPPAQFHPDDRSDLEGLRDGRY